MSNENDKLNQKVTELQEQIKGLERLNQQQKTNLEESMKLRQNINKEKEQQEEQIKQLQKTHEEEITNLSKKHQQEIENAKKEKQQLEKKMSQLVEDQKIEIENTHQQANKKNKELEHENQELKHKIEESQELVEQVEKKIQDKETETKIALKKNERFITELKDQLNREKKKSSKLELASPKGMGSPKPKQDLSSSKNRASLPANLSVTSLPNDQTNSLKDEVDAPASILSNNQVLSADQLQEELNQTVLKLGNLQSSNFELEENNKLLRETLKQRDRNCSLGILPNNTFWISRVESLIFICRRT